MVDRTSTTFAAALERAGEVGYVSNLREVYPSVYTGIVNEQFGSIALCRELARTLPGNGFPSKGLGGCSWHVGIKHFGTLLHPNRLTDLYGAQGIAENILKEEYKPKWSIGATARQLLTWVRPGRQDNGYTADAETLMQGSPYGYHECTPGLYEKVRYYDVRGYYYNMMCRLKSLNVYVGPKLLHWLPTPNDEWERFQSLLYEVQKHKPLRNQLAGNMAGSTPSKDAEPNFMVSYCKKTERVEIRKIPYNPGRFRAAGLLLVRSGAELTWHQCDRLGADAVYSNVDCVFTQGAEPTLWKDHGFMVELKAEGKARVVRRGSWRIGKQCTKPYRFGQKEALPVARGIPPEVHYSFQWLS